MCVSVSERRRERWIEKGVSSYHCTPPPMHAHVTLGGKGRKQERGSTINPHISHCTKIPDLVRHFFPPAAEIQQQSTCLSDQTRCKRGSCPSISSGSTRHVPPRMDDEGDAVVVLRVCGIASIVCVRHLANYSRNPNDLDRERERERENRGRRKGRQRSASLLVAGLPESAREPLKTLVETVTGGGTGRLDVLLASS